MRQTMFSYFLSPLLCRTLRETSSLKMVWRAVMMFL
jgi:hypothetical protein